MVALAAGAAYFLGDGAATPTATPTMTPASTSSAAAVATIGQYAGIVNSSITDIRKDWSSYDRNCWNRSPRLATCPIAALSLGMAGQILDLKLQGAAKLGAPAYIGAPPAEIARLVADTQDAARKLSTVGQAQTVDEMQLFLAVSDLLDQFDRWEPYI